MAYQYVLTWALLASVVATVLAFGLIGRGQRRRPTSRAGGARVVQGSSMARAAVFFWGAFLDKNEHDPGRVRAVMFLMLFAVTSVEIGLTLCGVVGFKTTLLAMFVNFWGGLDALLRFPAAHDLESWFSAKQFMLLLVKTACYAFGFIGFKQHIGKFIALILLNVWGLPVLYLMALPLDPCEQVAEDEYDVDLALRVWQLAMCSKERRKSFDTCRSWVNRKLVAASERSPLARMAICAASPQYRRAFNKKGIGGFSLDNWAAWDVKRAKLPPMAHKTAMAETSADLGHSSVFEAYVSGFVRGRAMSLPRSKAEPERWLPKCHYLSTPVQGPLGPDDRNLPDTLLTLPQTGPKAHLGREVLVGGEKSVQRSKSRPRPAVDTVVNPSPRNAEPLASAGASVLALSAREKRDGMMKSLMKARQAPPVPLSVDDVERALQDRYR
ncbi:unnamed protein product [Effrenium voratum]|nr:unnamed protein product [Effrenium voratum]